MLLAAIALLWAMPCWGKPIDLHGKWEHKKKSIPIGLPMDASIEEANRELIVNFHEDLGDVFLPRLYRAGCFVIISIPQARGLCNLNRMCVY